jgi:hypothetical protein
VVRAGDQRPARRDRPPRTRVSGDLDHTHTLFSKSRVEEQRHRDYVVRPDRRCERSSSLHHTARRRVHAVLASPSEALSSFRLKISKPACRLLDAAGAQGFEKAISVPQISNNHGRIQREKGVETRATPELQYIRSLGTTPVQTVQIKPQRSVMGRRGCFGVS